MNFGEFDSGSFRDPGGQIFVSDNKVYRTVNKSKASIYEVCKKSGIYDYLAEKKLLLPLSECNLSDFSLNDDTKYLLEHPKLSFISYPYEWSFLAHKKAALLHLDLHIELLNKNFTLIDATAYNVQFIGTEPIFIDHLSIAPYVDGEIWMGHKQFCTQFLNPLLLWSHADIAPNSWFRGNLEGISIEDTAKVLPLSKKLSWTVFTHVTLQAMLQKKALNNNNTKNKETKAGKLSKTSLIGILTGLRSYISKLKGPDTNTVWANYENDNTYSDNDAKIKKSFVQEMVQATNPKLLYDIGCNTGLYSDAALEAGAENVIGFDFDYSTLDFGFERFSKEKKNITPLWLDAANPSPNQGWAQAERKGLMNRSHPDALVALAFIHHIVIGRNIPMAMALDWLTQMAPTGVIEFPNKEDPMVQKLLSLREDIFPDYTEDNFLKLLSERAEIKSSKHLDENGRLLVWFKTR